LGHVLHRWKDILKHMEAKNIEHQHNTFISNGGFAQHYNRQVLPIHVTAFYLMPQMTVNDIKNDNRAISLGFEQQITGFFCRYSSSEDNAKTLICEFMSFRAQQPPFKPFCQCWEEWEDTWLFWCNVARVGNRSDRVGFIPLPRSDR